MSRVANKLITSASGSAGAFEIDQSLMFDQASNSQLSRVVSSAGNRKTYTFSTWIKKTSQDDWQSVISVDSHIAAGGNDNSGLYFYEDTIYIVDYDYSTTNWLLRTNRLFRDNSAWYHIVYVVDTTQGTAANRVKLYVNGVQETSFSTASYPGADVQGLFNSTLTDRLGGTLTTRVGNGGQITTTNGMDGILAETHFIDGTALTPSSFGETNSATGQWIPKEVSGLTYGTNGFYFPYQEGGQSVFFGTNQKVYIDGNNAAINVGTGDYTYEFWFYNTGNAGNYPYIIDSGSGGNAGSVYIDVPNSSRLLYHAQQASTAGPSNVVFATSTALNTWYHVAISRSSGTTSCYLNGTRGAEVTDNGNYSSQNTFMAGGYIPNNSYNFTGLISNLRIIKGSGIYSGSSITVPTARLTNVTNTSVLILQGSGNSAAEATVGPTPTNSGATVDARRPSSFTTGVALMTDHSGQGNDYTAINLANSHVVTDTPTNNFPTLNPSMGNAANGITLSEGNLKAAQASLTSDTAKTYSTIGLISGKWYVEVACSAANVYGGNGVVNVSQSSEGFDFSSSTNNVSVFSWGDRVYKNGSQTQTGVANAAGSSNILGIALDLDNGTVQLYSNGSTTGSAETLTRNTGDIFVFCNAAESGGYASTSAYEWNFGQNGTHSGTKTAGGNTDGNGIGNYMYSVPSGFLAPCSANLPDPAIKKSSEHFNTVTYTGSDDDAVSQSVTGVGFQPDLIWIKKRSDTAHHVLTDSVRGATKALNSSQNVGEVDDTYGVTAFGADGFTVREQASAGGQVNTGTLVAWNWKAGGSTPSKTYVVKVVSDSGNKYRFDDFGASTQTIDLQEGGTYTFDQSDSSNSGHPFRFSTTSNGSHGGGSEYTTGVTTYGTPGNSGAYTRITVAASAATLYYYCTAHSGMGGQANTNSDFGSSYFDGDIKGTVSANPTAGFSIVNYVPNGTASATIPHGLGVAPDMVFYKRYNGTSSWFCWTTAIDGSDDYMVLSGTDAATAVTSAQSGGTSFTSSFIRATNYGASGSPEVVAYCFAEVEGFSKFGAYEANNSTNGPFINTGFTPAWILFKYVDGTGEWWWMLDSTRDTANLTTEVLYANANSAEGAIGGGGGVDFLSNGFKIRATNGGINTANTYFYMAFAESPFKYANAR